MKIGVLALQGAFTEHIEVLDELGAAPVPIRQQQDFTSDLKGLIIPGGESTVMRKLLQDTNLLSPIQAAINAGMPVFGTCAGLILLAKEIVGEEHSVLGTMDIRVQRNAYGRQLGSFVTEGQYEGVGKFPMVFIRAPVITAVGPDTKVLAVVDGRIVAAKQQNMLAVCFHPELTKDTRIHEEFLAFCFKVHD